jgi:hypothetical protein
MSAVAVEERNVGGVVKGFHGVEPIDSSEREHGTSPTFPKSSHLTQLRERRLPPDSRLSALDSGVWATVANDGAPELTKRVGRADVLRAGGLRLSASERFDREIAKALNICSGTVGVRVSHNLGRLGVPSRAASVAHAHKHRRTLQVAASRNSLVLRFVLNRPSQYVNAN